MSEDAQSWNDSEHNPFSDTEERKVLFAALDSFRQYRKTAHFNVTHRRRQNFYALPTVQWQMLAEAPFEILKTLEQVDDAIDANAEIAEAILNSALKSFAVEADPKDPADDWRNTATASDVDKARSTIRQMYRDWSDGGLNERTPIQELVIGAVDQYFAHVQDRSSVRVLVPGAGLGRLVFEMCSNGYAVEGNEISYHQLLASNWILNHTEKLKQYDLYPFASEFSNVISRQHQLKSVKIPDVHPGSELQAPKVSSGLSAAERMSMSAADFVPLYKNEAHREAYEVVATVFFVDTAPNVIRYIEAIRNCLKEDGIWINHGPLLWHFADRAPPDYKAVKKKRYNTDEIGIEEPGSVELSNEELLLLVEKMGFKLEEHRLCEDGGGYIQNPSSMLHNVYKPSFWIARKKQIT